MASTSAIKPADWQMSLGLGVVVMSSEIRAPFRRRVAACRPAKTLRRQRPWHVAIPHRMSLQESSAAAVAAVAAVVAPADVSEDGTETTRRPCTLPFSPLFSSTAAAAAAAEARRSRVASLPTSTSVAATGGSPSPTSRSHTTRPAPKRCVSDSAGHAAAASQAGGERSQNPQPPPYEQPPQIAYGWWVPTPPPFGPYFWPCIPPGYALVPVSRAATAGENDADFLLSQETASLKRSPDLCPQQESQNLIGGDRASKCRRVDESTTSRTISTASLGSLPAPATP